MNGTNYVKLLYIVLYIALAAVSCWATQESLHLLLPSWPAIASWLVTIAFFVVASYSTKLIADSLNMNIFVEKRGAKLVWGILLAILFWLVCSMPTNTHTFFYRSVIADVALQDLSTTKAYLQKLKDNVKTEQQIKEKQDQLDNEVNVALTALFNEIDNIANPGFGDRAKEHLVQIAQSLGSKPISVLSYRGTSPAQRKMLKDQYQNMVAEMLEKSKAKVAENMRNTQERAYKAEAAKNLKNIETMEGEVKHMSVSGDVDNNLVLQADVALRSGYATIKNYHDFIVFNNEADRELYLQENQVTKVSRMLSVIDVWKDFVDGKYEGRGVIFWVLISILVDVGAFVCFILAFKEEE